MLKDLIKFINEHEDVRDRAVLFGTVIDILSIKMDIPATQIIGTLESQNFNLLMDGYNYATKKTLKAMITGEDMILKDG
jgi:hypothetical protein